MQPQVEAVTTTAPPRARSRARLAVAVALMALAAAPLASGNSYHLHLAVLVCLNAIFVMSLGVIARVGQLSFAHAAFIGIGAYASTLAVMRLGFPFLAAVAVAGVLGVLVAAGIGWITLRLRGVYFVLITFATGELVRLLLLDFPSISGGANGIPGVPPASLFGYALTDKADFYLFALAAAALVYAFTAALLRSPMGRAFRAIEENLALAEGSGIDTRRYQLVAFVIGSGIASAGGALLAHYIGYISPETFHFGLTITLIIMLVVGGRHSLYGAPLGALFLTPLPEVLRGAQELQHILFGVVLIVALRFLPHGLGGLVDRWRERAKP